MTGPAARRRLPVWLPVVGAALGVAIVAVRLATAPLDRTGTYLLALALGAIVVAVVVGLRVLVRRATLRDATAAYPGALLVPIVVGVDTAAATRWIARQLPDPDLALDPDRHAVAVFDGEGLRFVDRRFSATIPAERLTLLPLGSARVGMRRRDALVVGVAVGDVVAPVPLVPTRANPLAPGPLRDAELLDASARIRSALAGAPAERGWDF